MRPQSVSERCSPLFELREIRAPRPKTGWAIAVAVHVLAAVIFLRATFSYTPSPEHARFITLPREVDLPPYGAARPIPARRLGGYGKPAPPAPVQSLAVSTPGVTDTATAVRPPAVGPRNFISGPVLGDGHLWVSPRPALPAEVAEQIYGDSTARDTVVVRRLRAMMDSLNQIYDEEQREHRRPSWTTDVGGRTFGIDSQYIHIAGIKIPTAVLALLPLNMPQGNFDEGLRSRHLEEMRQDIMRAAARAQTYQDFRRYVRELRARTDAEREFQRRQKQPADTVKAIP